MRRAGCLVALLLVLSSIGASTVLSFIVRSRAVSLPQVTILALLAPLALVTLFAIFFTVMRRIGQPIGNIVEAADRVAAGDLSTRVDESGPPVLRSVARAFNAMTGRLQSQDQQRRHLMADIAHELRTPVTVIQGRLEGLLDGVYPRDDEQLAELLGDTQVLARLIEDLRTLANAESGTLSLRKEPTDIAILVQDAVNSFRAEAEAARVRLDIDADSNLPLIEIDPVRIREVLANVVSNAIRHTPEHGTIAISVETIGDRLVVTVKDNGAGIPPENLDKIFDRFYKGETSRGSGLGLTIAKNLVVAHNGEIRAESSPGNGTIVTITLPLDSIAG